MTETPLLPPRCAGRFVVERTLGTGGQGVVYLATQVTLERQVALKLLLVEDPEFQARFLQEAQVAARLSHPHVVAIIDHDVEDGRPWIAYEYVAGMTLRKRLDLGPLPWAEAVRHAAAIASGLAAAHEIGAVHRDVKPENILLGGEGPKLTDFGLARWVGTSAIGTQSGIMLGTPAYMAPEVVLGERATASADLYALGVVLFEMITGQPPFEADQPIQLLRAALDPVPPEKLAGVEAPGAVRELIGRCLAKDRSLRPASAHELAEALGAIGAAGAGGANPRGMDTRVQRVASRGIPAPGPRISGDTVVVRSRAGRVEDAAVPAVIAQPRGSRTALAAGAAVVVTVVLVIVRVAPPWRSVPAGDVAPVAPVPGPASVAVPALPAAPLDALDRRVDILGQEIEAAASEVRWWEMTLSNSSGVEADVTVPRRLSAAFASRMVELVELAKELRLRNESEPDSVALESLRARAAGMSFEVWFWKAWIGQYVRSGQTTFSATDLLLTPGKGQPVSGGLPLFREFSVRLSALLRGIAREPARFDHRAADALFQVSRAFRYLRAARDEHLFAERSLPGEMDRWRSGLAALPAPLGPALHAMTDLLARSAVESADARKLLPEVQAVADTARHAHPGSDRGWVRLVYRMHASR